MMPSPTSYRIGIAGSNGLIGQSIIRFIKANGIDGKEVNLVRIVRKKNVPEGEEDPNTSRPVPTNSKILSDVICVWDGRQTIEKEKLEGLDCLINFAGEPLAEAGDEKGVTPGAGEGQEETADDHSTTFWSRFTSKLGSWDEAKKATIRSSRLDSTRLLVKVIAELNNPPSVFLNASGAGIYGIDNQKKLLDENSPPGGTFLAQLSVEWEKEAMAAADKTRVVLLRMGVVLTARGGMLKRLLPVVHMRAGGRLGSGEQEMSWVTLLDVARAIEYIFLNDEISGPVNVTATQPTTNSALMTTLHEKVHPNSWISLAFPIPHQLLVSVLGQFAEEILLGGQSAIPKKLAEKGFQFVHPNIESAIDWVLEEEKGITNLSKNPTAHFGTSLTSFTSLASLMSAQSEVGENQFEETDPDVPLTEIERQLSLAARSGKKINFNETASDSGRQSGLITPHTSPQPSLITPHPPSKTSEVSGGEGGASLLQAKKVLDQRLGSHHSLDAQGELSESQYLECAVEALKQPHLPQQSGESQTGRPTEDGETVSPLPSRSD